MTEHPHPPSGGPEAPQEPPIRPVSAHQASAQADPPASKDNSVAIWAVAVVALASLAAVTACALLKVAAPDVLGLTLAGSTTALATYLVPRQVTR